MSGQTAARDAHTAYLSRKLDIQERMAALKERELALEEQKLALEIRQWEHHLATEDSLRELKDSLTSLIGTAVDDDDDVPPMFSRNSRGRA